MGHTGLAEHEPTCMCVEIGEGLTESKIRGRFQSLVTLGVLPQNTQSQPEGQTYWLKVFEHSL